MKQSRRLIYAVVNIIYITVYFRGEIRPGKSVEDGVLVVLGRPAGPFGTGVPQKVNGVIRQHLGYEESLVLTLVQIADTCQERRWMRVDAYLLLACTARFGMTAIYVHTI